MIFWFVVILVIGVILISMIGIFWGRPQRWDTRRRRTLFGSSFNRETIAAESINIIAQEQQRHHVRHMHHSGSRGAERPSSPNQEAQELNVPLLIHQEVGGPGIMYITTAHLKRRITEGDLAGAADIMGGATTAEVLPGGGHPSRLPRPMTSVGAIPCGCPARRRGYPVVGTGRGQASPLQ